MPKVGIIIPTTSKGRNYQNYKDSYLYKYTLNSIRNTLCKNHNYHFYIGIDNDDKFFKRNKKHFYKLNIKITFIEFNNTYKGKVGLIWNKLCEKAIEGNCEYIHQTGDDIQYLDKGWVSNAINFLKDIDNVGVCGHIDINNVNTVFTQATFHRSHFDILGYVFPPEIINWHIDDYITELYIRIDKRVAELPNKLKNCGGETRYDIVDNRSICDNCLRRDIPKIVNYLEHNVYKQKLFNFSLISINTPIYNRKNFKPLIIHNLKNIPDNLKDFIEYNILDDSNKSPLFDNDSELEEFKKEVAPIKVNYYFDDKWNSIGYKRDKLVELSNGEIIAHLDSDDIYLPDYIPQALRQICFYDKWLCGTTDCITIDTNDNYKEHASFLRYSLSHHRYFLEAIMIFRKDKYNIKFKSDNKEECLDFCQSIPKDKVSWTDFRGNILVLDHKNNTDKEKIKRCCGETKRNFINDKHRKVLDELQLNSDGF